MFTGYLLTLSKYTRRPGPYIQTKGKRVPRVSVDTSQISSVSIFDLARSELSLYMPTDCILICLIFLFPDTNTQRQTGTKLFSNSICCFLKEGRFSSLFNKRTVDWIIKTAEDDEKLVRKRRLTYLISKLPDIHW